MLSYLSFHSNTQNGLNHTTTTKMPRTRSSKAVAADFKDETKPTSSASKYQIDTRSSSPPKLFILPTKASKDARIVTLPNPRNAKPSRYLVCPTTGIYEFTKIAAPKTTPRSWLIQTEEKDGETAQGQITADADLFVATAIDAIFIVLPALADMKAKKSSEEQKRLFLTSDDHFDKLSEESSHLSEILRWEKTRALIEARMSAICDTLEAGDETMFRLNDNKLVGVLLDKARKMSEGGLPASMEDKFVTKALEAPMVLQNLETTTVTIQTVNKEKYDAGEATPASESVESESISVTAESAVSQPSTAATSFVEETSEVMSAMQASAEIVNLQRLKVAFNFICSSYITPLQADQLQASLPKDENTDFTPLDGYLSKLTKLRAEAATSRSMGDYSRKHARDEEAEEAREEKKRRLEEEKKKKASQSRGVRQLNKVNTTGMKKLSAFFTKK